MAIGGMTWGRSDSEHLQVPLLIASNTIDMANLRSQQLVQPHHLFQTLLDWFELEHPWRSAACSLLALPSRDLCVEGADWPPLAAARLGDKWALRTAVWHACLSAPDAAAQFGKSAESGADDGGLAGQLYLKPDDRWEVNDVASRCPDVIARFAALCQMLSAVPAASSLEDALPLDPILSQPPE